LKGVIVFSFAWRKEGHSPCNVRLAKAAIRIVRELEKSGEMVVVVAQRTTAAVMEELGLSVDLVIQKRAGYEGSEEVVAQADEWFKTYGINGDRITKVIPVANPFIHLFKCIQLVQKKGFKTLSFWKLARMIGWIGFDRRSEQPATRGPIRLVFYTARQVLFGYRNPVEQSEP